MIYDLDLDHDRNKAVEYFEKLLSKGVRIELKEKRLKRTIKQNSYLHLILSWFAWKYGETLEYVKQEMFKKVVNVEIFKSERTNEKLNTTRIDWKSTKDLDTGQLTTAINRFRDYSSKYANIYLPVPEDLVHLQEIEKQLKNNNAKNYI